MKRNLLPHNVYFYWSFRMSEFLSMFWFVKVSEACVYGQLSTATCHAHYRSLD